MNERLGDESSMAKGKMNRKLIGSFLRDKVSIIIIFILNTFTVLLFFNIAPGTRKEVFYPLVLSGFFLLVMVIIEWIKYYGFNKRLLEMSENPQINLANMELKTVTVEQKEIARAINAAYERYFSELNQIKSQGKNRNYFLSQWIHNLKTPVSVIDLIVQKCSLEKTDPHVAIEHIKQENKRLYNSLEQVLTIIRLEDFEKDYEPQTIDIVQQIKKLLNERKKQFIFSDVLPQLSCQSEKMLVLSDEKWNHLMLDQVISNAIKYSKDQGKSKKIYINIETSGDHTLLSIKDEGIGIPAYDVPRVFEPFFTGENGRKYRDSTGIGLHVCSEIARKLGHQISIRSQRDEGADKKTEAIMEAGTIVTITYITKL